MPQFNDKYREKFLKILTKVHEPSVCSQKWLLESMKKNLEFTEAAIYLKQLANYSELVNPKSRVA